MSGLFEELDYRQTVLGELILRRRRILKLDRDVVEVILNDEHLMSDMFTASEIALASIPLERMLADGAARPDILVGGLGLGYTADAVLRSEAAGSLAVVEYLAPLIEWHEAGILPLGRRLADDPRCRFIEGDFFALARSDDGFDPQAPGRRFDGIFLDIDHSPDFHLNPSHADFYSDGGLARLSRSLKDRGVFALWSNDPPDEAFLSRLASQFSTASAEEVVFHNPLLDEDCVQTVYMAIRS
ncbi:MAG: spermidine synthase [Pseudomonadota bacterium]|nr:spermidine synthase [Pseudomonadota bacterium]